MTPEQLMQKFKDGSTAALTTLYERFKSPLRRFIIKRSGCDDLTADEITNDVFVRVAKHASRYDGWPLSPWLFCIARNLAANHVRDSTRRAKLANALFVAPKDANLEDSDMAMELLGRLPPKLRVCLTHYINGHSSREIGPLVGVCYRQVQNRINAGLSILREQMGA